MIRAVIPSDATALVDIYNHYIQHSTATFEEQIIDASAMSSRIAKVERENLPWLVLEEAGEINGYAYATKWKERSAYRYSVETTVYIAADGHKKGMGTQLYQALFSELRLLGIKTAIGGITLPNDASIALHEKMNMRKVAHFEKVGFKFNQWLDVGYWQTHL